MTTNRVVLTAKKSLVESKRPVLHRFIDARVGQITDAFVIKCVETGLIIGFYNKLKAFVPRIELTQVILPSARSSFHIYAEKQVIFLKHSHRESLSFQ